MRWVQFTKTQVEHIVGCSRQSHIFDFGRHLVVNNGLLILAHNVDSKLKSVMLSQFMWLGFTILGRQSLAIDKRPIGGFDVADVHLAVPFGPDFCVLARQDFGVKIAVDGCRNGFGIGLPADPQDVWEEGQVDLFSFKGPIHRQQGKDGGWFARGRGVGDPGSIGLIYEGLIR